MSEQNTWLSKVFNNHPDPMVISRIRDGRIDRVNPAFLSLFGYTQTEVIGKRSLDLFMIEEIDRRKTIDLLIKQGHVQDKQVSIRIKSGDIRKTSLTLIKIDDDDEPRILTIIHDITERNHIEDRLAHDQEIIQHLIDNIPVILVFWDPNLQKFTLNRHAESVLGWTTADANEGDFMSKIYPDPVYRSEVAAFMQSLSTEWREWDIIAKNGSIIPTTWTNTYLSDETMIGIGLDLRERSSVLDALRESRDNFRIALANSNFIPSQFDLDLRYRWIYNPHPDFGPAFLIGKRDDELDGSQSGRQLMALKQQVIDTGMGVREELAFDRSDGTRFYDFVIEPLYNADGEITGGTSAGYDITRQKLAELSLRESEERFRTMADGLPLIIWVTDAEGRQQFVNRTYLEFFGVTEEEIKKKGWHILVHPDDADAYAAEFKACMSQRRPFHAMVRVWHASGVWRWIESWGRPRFDPSGEFTGYVGTSADITERKKAEDEMRNSQARIRFILDAVPDLFFVFDRQGVYLDYYASDESLLAAPPGKLLGKTIFETLPKDVTDPYLKCMEQAFETKNIQVMEYTLKLAGELRSFEARIAVMGDDRVISIVRDITERRRAVEALRHLNETLEKQVVERTSIAESRAKQLQALAVELVQAEEFERRRIADFLHEDLQQLIASARMQVQAAVATSDPGPILENVERLLGESLEKSRHLSHELSPPVLHQFGLAAGLEWLVRYMDEKFGLKVLLESKLVGEVRDAPLRVFLFRAAQELLFNVVKHSGVDSADVQLYEADNVIGLSVSDQGKGFDPAVLDSFTRKAGVGLVSLRERAGAIGGDLDIESAPGRGSRFTLTAPISLEVMNEAEKITRANASSHGIFEKAGVLSDSENIRVLLVDDHKVMRQGLVSMIESQPGIQVAGEAGSGEEALELSRQLRPDVIIMDISMPGMGGVEATRRIKAENSGIRVIGLSMFTDEDISQKMREAGSDRFVSKSESSSELLKAIYEVVLG